MRHAHYIARIFHLNFPAVFNQMQNALSVIIALGCNSRLGQAVIWLLFHKVGCLNFT